jgi:hypothetical protein
MNIQHTRRKFLGASAAVGTGLLLNVYHNATEGQAAQQEKPHASSQEDEKTTSGEVTAVEDLMREHGVLRRALLVYTAAAAKLRSSPYTDAPAALQKTATLFRAFGEEYHEKKLEETYIFPAVKLGEQFEEIEHQQFGEDGFEDAVKQLSDIEGSLGLADFAQFTAPPPPKL